MTGKQYGQQTIETVSRDFNPDFDLLSQGYQRFGRLSPVEIRGGVRTPADCITVEASAHNSPIPARVGQTPPRKSLPTLPQYRRYQKRRICQMTSTAVRIWDVPPDGKKRTFTAETWVDATWTPWVGWENGPRPGFQGGDSDPKVLPEPIHPAPGQKGIQRSP